MVWLWFTAGGSAKAFLMKQYAQVVSHISLTLNTPKVAVGLIVRYMNLPAKASSHSEKSYSSFRGLRGWGLWGADLLPWSEPKNAAFKNSTP